MTRSTWMLSIIIAIFTLPILAAKILYYYAPEFSIQTQHHGHLIQPTVPISLTDSTNPISKFQRLNRSKWQLIYLLPEKHTFDPTQKIQQVILGLKDIMGEQSLRIETKFITPTQISSTESTLPLDKKILIPGTLLLADPKQRLLMSYSQNTLINHPQGIVRDLKRLLKVSRIG